MTDESSAATPATTSTSDGQVGGFSALPCPHCGVGHLRFKGEWAACDNCDHRTPTAFAAELLTYESRNRALLARRDWLVAQVAAGSTSRYVDLGLSDSQTDQPWRVRSEQWVRDTAGTVGPPPLALVGPPPPTSLTQMAAGPPRRPPRKAVLPKATWTIASALYLLGGALVVFAIVGVAALTWRHLGAFGQGALLLFAAVALAAVAHVSRRRVPGLAMTFSVLATITVPIAILEASYQRGDFGLTWYPTLAAASGAVFALGGWRISRLASYAWAFFALLELGLLLSYLPLSGSSNDVGFGAFLLVLAGTTAITAFSAVTRASRRLRTPAFIFGTVGLLASTLAALSVRPLNQGFSTNALALLLVALCGLMLNAVWQQRRARAVPYIAWGLLYLAVALLGFGPEDNRTISWWTPVPLAVVSIAALARAGTMWRWPRYAAFAMSTIALAVATAFGIPGMLHEGGGHAWWWKAYVALCAIAILTLDQSWARFGSDAVRAAKLFGWILLTSAIATIGLVWVAPGVVPGPAMAIPLLAWSVVLLALQGRVHENTREIVFAVGITGLGLASIASLFALSPVHRTAWSLYALVVAVVIVIGARALQRNGVPGQILAIAASAVVSLPLSLACVELASTNGQATYLAAVLVAAIGALCAFVPHDIRRRLSAFDTDAFAVSVWVFGGIGIVTNLVDAAQFTVARITGTYLLLVALSLVAVTARRRWYIAGWVAAGVASAGWLFLFSTWATLPIEIATVPIAVALLAAGLCTWYLRNATEQSTSSYFIFTPALLVALIPSVLASWVTSDLGHPGTRWFTLVVAATALTIAGAVWRLAGIFVPAVAALLLALLPQVVAGGSQLLAAVPSWLFFAVIGAALIGCAARLEWLRGAGRQSRRWFASLT